MKDKYMESNSYYAKFRVGFKTYLIPCQYLEVINGSMIIKGTPLSGQIGYTTVLAYVPNTIFVQLIPKKIK